MAPPSGSPYARGFAADAETERALRAGLAGREAKVQRGRFASALRTLVTEPSSQLVFVDLDGAAVPEAAARELAAVCAFGTALIAIGSIDTADFTRALLQHGVADYLVKPISAAAVREACAAALDDLPERTYAGRVIAFAGTAGSGASTLVAAIARGLAAGGRTAVVVDLDPVGGTLATGLGTKPAGDLTALLATLEPGQRVESDERVDPDEPLDFDPSIDSEQLDDVCVPADAGLSVVAYPPNGPLSAPPSPAAIRVLLEHLANRAHVVLVAGLFDPDARTGIMQQADARVLLYEPTLPSISAAVHCLAMLGNEHPAILVQCHPRMRKSALSPAQIRYALAERRPDVVIPFEPALHAAATGEKRLRSPGKAYRKALRQVAERVIEGPISTAS